jgi:hypothetical protein
MPDKSDFLKLTTQSKELINKSYELHLETLHTMAVTMEANKTIREHIERMHQEIKTIDITVIGFKDGNTLFNGSPTLGSSNHKPNNYLFKNQLIK